MLMFLIDHPIYAACGFQKGFGKLLFQVLVMEKNQAPGYVLYNLSKLHILGVRDPEFLALVDNLLDKNADIFVVGDRYPVYYIWRNLSKSKNQRVAMRERLRQLQTNVKHMTNMPSYQLVHFFMAALEMFPTHESRYNNFDEPSGGKFNGLEETPGALLY